ncbi:acriflavin resistance protein [Calothrix sp. NIES-4071]|nr:acriflavin resistance protein [Calothrix sp. NIES-4071]BAZ57456.1 acriflavin resistance protein [Calothrix sp. NIES-4105]
MVKVNPSNSARDRFNISRVAIQNSWLTLSFWVAVMVAGILAFSSLKYALFPDITFPVVVVNANAPLTTAEDTEAKLTKIIEQRLTSLENLDDIRSSTYPGQAVVSVAFAVGTDLDESKLAVESAIKQVKLVDGAQYQVIPFNLNESAAVSYAVESSKLSLNDLAKLTKDRIVPSVSKLPGVLRVVVLGDSTPDLNQATNEPTTSGATRVRFNSKDALAFQVIKRGDANTLEVVSRVEQEVSRLSKNLPSVKLSLASTQAEYIRRATHATIDSLIEAIVLSVIVIYPFLRNWSATLISALAIPISLVGTFIVMALFGFNLETITLLALALVIGSIIDDAIVDVENIMRHIDKGETPRQAALSATSEIGLTVTAATLTAVAVFLPIGLMGGVIGQFFKPFGITVSAAMLTSLLVARTLSPVLAIYSIKPNQRRRAAKNSEKSWGYFAQRYQDVLRWSLNHRKIVMGLALLSFVIGIAIIPIIPKGFIPKLDRGEFNITYTASLSKLIEQSKQAAQDAFGNFLTPGDTSSLAISSANASISDPLNYSLEIAKKLEAVVRNSNVETIFTTVGSREGEPNKGTLYVKLKENRTVKTADVQEQLRARLPKLPDVTISVEDIQFVDTGTQKPLQVALQGENLKSLYSSAASIAQRLKKIPGFADISYTGEGNTGDIFEIERLNNQRVAYISANLGKDLSLGDATDKLVESAKTIIPSDVKLDLGGDSARQKEVLGSFGSTLLLSALCIIIVLVGLFGGWQDPLVIGISLPLALVGAVIALLITRSDFGMISLIGFVFLLGISNKNAILLVDYINQLRREGASRSAAILEAGPVRFRPIIMTTVATILGMVPIALGIGAGSELRSPMAVAIAGGLISSTVLSLIVVPVLYTILDDWFKRKQFKNN